MKAKSRLTAVKEMLKMCENGEAFEFSQLSNLEKGKFFKMLHTGELFIFRGKNQNNTCFLFDSVDILNGETIQEFKTGKDKKVMINFNI